MIDILTEDVISLAEAAKQLPGRRGGKRPHVSCLYRWTIGGCRGVVLESVQVGGARCTSRQALARFIERLSVAPGRSATPGTGVTAGRLRHLRRSGITRRS